MAIIGPPLSRVDRARAESQAGRFPPGLRVALTTLSAALLGGGCATPGPNHIYTFSPEHVATIRDTGPTDALDVPSFVATEDRVTGLAYDPYTDHLFLRLAPGNHIRVVDRPDRSIKREFTIQELPSTGGGDLAVRPRDGHLFFACPAESFVIESDRFGNFVRRLELDDLKAGAVGIAYDAMHNRLLVAVNGAKSELRTYDLEGRRLRTSTLDFANITSLAYDATSREVYAAVADEPATLVLNEEGQLLRKVPAERPVDFLDLGQRSFVRVF